MKDFGEGTTFTFNNTTWEIVGQISDYMFQVRNLTNHTEELFILHPHLSSRKDNKMKRYRQNKNQLHSPSDNHYLVKEKISCRLCARK
ncbi:hypothetical protein [Bacillus sp. EB01]|uniref:hypothetical protein n=1 Tax=Bacillus sp. EB01 TaxID=1347086 RepID=UPI0005C458E1|nr:hypothetical protein [Bacillus sp. EB01]